MPELPPPAALRALRALGPFFTLGRDPLNGGHAAHDLLADDTATDEVITRYADRLGTSRRDIAGSLFLQGWAGRVLSVHLGCLALTGAAPDLTRLTFRYDDAGPVQLALAPPPTTRWDWAQLWGLHLAPLAAAVEARCGPGERRLHGNIASAYAGALVHLRRRGHVVPLDLPAELAAYGEWDGDPDRPRYRRRTCCNLFRVEGYGLCGDCVIPPHRVP